MIPKTIIPFFILLIFTACSTSLESLDVDKFSNNELPSDSTGRVVLNTIITTEEYKNNQYLNRKLRKISYVYFLLQFLIYPTTPLSFNDLKYKFLQIMSL